MTTSEIVRAIAEADRRCGCCCKIARCRLPRTPQPPRCAGGQQRCRPYRAGASTSSYKVNTPSRDRSFCSLERNDRAVLVQHRRERRDAYNWQGWNWSSTVSPALSMRWRSTRAIRPSSPMGSSRQEVHIVPQEAAGGPAGHDNICVVVGGGDVQENPTSSTLAPR